MTNIFSVPKTIDEIKRRLTFMDKYPHIRQQQSRFNMLYSKYKRILWSRAGIMWG